MIECTSCGCCWDATGYYTHKGAIIQPCIVCRCDTSSVYYVNNAEQVRAKRRERYYADLEATRARERERKRLARAAATA